MGHRTLTSVPALFASIPCPRAELCLDLVLASGRVLPVYDSCDRTPLSAFSPSSVPPTTILPESLAWWNGSARLWTSRLIQLDDITYHGFPSLQALAGPEVEAQLRKLGLGYRATCGASARAILEEKRWQTACLMALDKTQAVPVDVHMWQIAQRDYGCAPHHNPGQGSKPPGQQELGAVQC
ncbi:N-Glycosylase/Dna Lyase [Manis pentadactyla]|nr:N-Glycosylase/Dna Lyase [Manis pentadactyla]